jgi:hypothetical protein
MASRSESYVRRMLRLLALSQDDAIAVAAGAPYTPFLARLRQRRRNPPNAVSYLCTIQPAIPVTWPATAF